MGKHQQLLLSAQLRHIDFLDQPIQTLSLAFVAPREVADRMSVHQSNKNSLPDSEFIPGDITFLVPGNSCRLLDIRRTPGVIEAYFEDSAMFRWRIMDFEDKGKYWDLPAEDIVRFQFTRDSKRLDNRTAGDITSAVNRYQATISIEATAKP